MTTHVDQKQPAKAKQPAPTVAALKAAALATFNGKPAAKVLPDRRIRVMSRFLRQAATYSRAATNLRRASNDALDCALPVEALLAALDASLAALRAAVDKAA